MPLPNILRKASNYILGDGGQDSRSMLYQDGEVLFCKNNVCVHPPTIMRQHCDVVHHPGYLTVTCRFVKNATVPTLHLSWIPNSTLRKHPTTLENNLSKKFDGNVKELDVEYQRQISEESYDSRVDYDSTPGNIDVCLEVKEPVSCGDCERICSGGYSKSESRSPRHKSGSSSFRSTPEYSGNYKLNVEDHSELQPDRDDTGKSVDSGHSNTNPVITIEENKTRSTNSTNQNSVSLEIANTEDKSEISTADVNVDEFKELEQASSLHLHSDNVESSRRMIQKSKASESLNKINLQESEGLYTGVKSIEIADGAIPKKELNGRSPDLKVTANNEIRIWGYDEDSVKSRSMSLTSTCSLSMMASTEVEEFPTWMRSPELLALQHNLMFPESATASPVTLRRAHRCRRFSADLSQMRSLRLFFADPGCTCGQLVVASRESQYKILHFHHGGLDRLARTLYQWHQLLYPRLGTDTEEALPYRQFMVCRPEVSQDELHPEEGQVAMITSLAWKDLLNERGQVEDDLALRKGIFFGGLEPALRKIVWPFLLHCYSYQSTYEEREQVNSIRKEEYEEIKRRRENMSPEQAEIFWRNVVCIVEKDVVRTDRGNPYYAGEDNPNIEIMKNILLNYAVYNSQLGYTQGMSDLLAPLLAELNSEAEAFWCFAGLMQRSVAVCTPTDTDMDRNLCYLRELIRIMVPDFYAHLEKHTDALELLFCHRWILLCLKREFPTEVALVMWEACWVNYLTDHFHLFLCLAIMCVYAEDVIAQDLKTDEMLLHFSSLAMYMDGHVIIRKARGLLHNFRQLLRLPCALAGLCRQCGPGMWDSSHNPVIECMGHGTKSCPYSENY
ncbi:TBC1 domain family member 16 [Athalia rosae]|uniref:TBC1 domain family member 16 n=1 Tax=Athalia rosae TaxID=37344 RepID=UPI0020333D7F|nr:TBC1 domain family member 16 [Athalia rosae]XP_048508811.1 TBC1 domain family member 16 [Athalia rosae]